MNKLFTAVLGIIAIILILGFSFWAFTNGNNNVAGQNDPTQTPTSTSTSTPSPANGVSENMIRAYDGVLNFEFSHPVDWYFYQAENELGESSINSFSIAQTPNTGGVPEDELKIGVVYFPEDGQRDLDIDESNVESEEEITVDGRPATKRVMTGLAGGSVSTSVEVNGSTYLFSAYPPNSELIEQYNQFLDSLEFADYDITIESPNSGESVSDTIDIEGEVPGNWFFEGVLSIRVETIAGEMIGEANATSTQDWMTTDAIPFSASVNIDETGSDRGYIVIEKSNPSGLQENELLYYWPISF